MFASGIDGPKLKSLIFDVLNILGVGEVRGERERDETRLAVMRRQQPLFLHQNADVSMTDFGPASEYFLGRKIEKCSGSFTV